MADEEVDYLEHFGVKGMKWGVRKNRDGGGSGGGSATAKKAKKAAVTQLPGNSSKKEVKKLSKMSKGEKWASFAVGGPIGMVVYKGGKIAVAKQDLADLGPAGAKAKANAVKANAKMSKGEKIVTAVLGGPPTMLMYKSGKVLGARIAANGNTRG